MEVLKDGEILCLPGRLLMLPSTRVLRPHHLALERKHLLIRLRPGPLLRLQGLMCRLQDGPLRLEGRQGLLKRCLGVHQGHPQPRLSLLLADLCRLEPLLGSSRPLRRTLPLRPRRGRLGRPDLGLAAGGLHPTLKLSHPGMFRPEEVGLAGRHLPYFL